MKSIIATNESKAESDVTDVFRYQIKSVQDCQLSAPMAVIRAWSFMEGDRCITEHSLCRAVGIQTRRYQEWHRHAPQSEADRQYRTTGELLSAGFEFIGEYTVTGALFVDDDRFTQLLSTCDPETFASNETFRIAVCDWPEEHDELHLNRHITEARMIVESRCLKRAARLAGATSPVAEVAQ